MGVRIAAYAVAFNVLFWLSRLTLGVVVAHRFGAGAGLAATWAAPLALLALAARVLPRRFGALVVVSAASLAAAALIAGT